MESKPIVDSTDFTFSIDIDFSPHVVVAHESWGESWDGVIVIHPAIVPYL